MVEQRRQTRAKTGVVQRPTLSVPAFGTMILLSGMMVACSGVYSGPPLDELPTHAVGPQSAGGVLTAAADLAELRQRLSVSSLPEPVRMLLEADLTLAGGSMGEAFQAYQNVAYSAYDHLEAVLALRRMTTMVDVIPGYHELLPALEWNLNHPSYTQATTDFHPLVDYYLTLATQHAGYRSHELGLLGDAPFSWAEHGVPGSWRYAGPFGRNARLDLTGEQLFSRDRHLASSYDVDGREVTVNELLGNQLLVSPPSAEPGVYVFEVWFQAAVSGPLEATFESGASAVVSLDGDPFMQRSEADDYDPRVLIRNVVLEPGLHRVRVRIGTDENSDLSFRFTLQGSLVQGRALTFVEPDASNIEGFPGHVFGSAERSALQMMLPQSVVGPNGPAGPYEALALIQIATDFGESGLAERGLAYLEAQPEVSAVVSLAAAREASRNATRPPSDRHNRRVQWVRHAVDGAPDAHGATLALVTLLLADGRDDEALRLLRPLERALPNEPAVAILLSDVYANRTWEELAERQLQRALAMDPDNCQVVTELVSLYTYREHYPRPDQLASGFSNCESGLRYQLDTVLLPAGDYEAALTLLGGLSSRYPTDRYYRARAFDILMQLERYDEAAAMLETTSWQDSFGVVGTALYRIDLLAAQGRHAAALDVVVGALDELQTGDVELQQLMAILQGERLLGDVRIDSLDALQVYNDRDVDLRGPVVYALDYGAWRYFPDGSGLALVHQILHIQTREALGDYGEVSIPGNAILLRARTIKADGTILEPDDIPGKDSISLPNLEVNDFVEYEYLQVIPPSRLRPETIVGSRFYFQVSDAPLFRSEMVIDVPTEWSELTFDIRTDAPIPEVENVGDFTRYHLITYNRVPPVDEPGAPNLTELLPSAMWAHDYVWEDVVGRYQDRREGVVRVTSDIRQLATELTVGVDDERERVRRIFRFAVDEIEETGGFLTVEAQWTLELGEGERLPLLLALLEAADVTADLVFLSTWSGDQTEIVIPDEQAYPETAIRVRLADTSEIWLDSDADHMPFDYIAPGIQGVRGLVIEHAAYQSTAITSPVWPPESNVHRVDMELTLDESGNLRADVTEVFPSRSTASNRSYFERIEDERDLIQGLESGLSGSFPRVVVEDVEILGLDEADTELRLNYHFTSSGFARVEDDSLSIYARLFDRDLRGALGAQPSREHPLSIEYPYGERLAITLRLPAGFEFDEIPITMSAGEPWLHYGWTVDVDDSMLRIVRDLQLHVGRVSAADYPAFLDELGEIDAAETLNIRAVRR